MQEKFSVLMSIYRKEKPEYARACFDSLLRQTVQAAQWVIVEDGPLTEELYAVLDEYEKAWPHIIKRVPFAENRGLGLALRDGVLNCDYPLIARMDTDDICREDRFEKQLAMFAADEKLDICGCQILEFDGSPDNIVACRKVPLTDGEIKPPGRTEPCYGDVQKGGRAAGGELSVLPAHGGYPAVGQYVPDRGHLREYRREPCICAHRLGYVRKAGRPCLF